jgi:hypothetical protein
MWTRKVLDDLQSRPVKKPAIDEDWITVPCAQLAPGRGDRADQSDPSVARRMALIVCRRFSA